MEVIKIWFLNFADKFGLFVIGGLIGAVIHRLRNQMSIKRFIATLVTSAFVGVVVGIALRNYLKLNEEITFAFVSTAGVFSKDIIDIINDIVQQVKKSVQYLSMFSKKILEKKTNVKLDE